MKIVIIRGGGDIATGIAHRLHGEGYGVVVLEIDKPLTVRRAVAFSEAVYEGENTVEGIKGVLVESREDIYRVLEEGNIPVYIDPTGKIIEEIKPLAVIDAIIAKKNLGTDKVMASITIAIGPGFRAGEDVDLVIESNRGPNLGELIYQGSAEADTKIPGEVMGFTEERVFRAPCDGLVKIFHDIGDSIDKGDEICKVGDEIIVAPFKGVLRGMIKEELWVKEGLKIGDIEPRCVREYAFIISDKAKVIGDSVLKGITDLSVKE